MIWHVHSCHSTHLLTNVNMNSRRRACRWMRTCGRPPSGASRSSAPPTRGRTPRSCSPPSAPATCRRAAPPPRSRRSRSTGAHRVQGHTLPRSMSCATCCAAAHACALFMSACPRRSPLSPCTLQHRGADRRGNLQRADQLPRQRPRQRARQQRLGGQRHVRRVPARPRQQWRQLGLVAGGAPAQVRRRPRPIYLLRKFQNLCLGSGAAFSHLPRAPEPHVWQGRPVRSVQLSQLRDPPE